uniref:Uncharacterized protein n=1 Tax=Rhodosorus marinus TaxID=101924 RepID=A0A7S0G083_9RHOD|mmetsp:Transcript_10811/g.15598  ORF Transcript_10811/g.15598 Transcript_10811/m.15598 type:complete len:523 (+) Transcript_10811:106-1674(+)
MCFEVEKRPVVEKMDSPALVRIRSGWGYLRSYVSSEGSLVESYSRVLLEETDRLRNGRKWSFVFEPVIEKMILLVERDYQASARMREQDELMKLYYELYEDLLLKDAPQTLHGRAHIESQEPAENNSSMSTRVTEVEVNDKREEHPVLGSLDFWLQGTTDPLKDGGCFNKSDFIVTDFYALKDLEQCFRRWIQVLVENHGNTRGLFQSFVQSFPHLSPFLDKVFGMESRKLRAYAAEPRSYASKVKPRRSRNYVPVDIVLPFDHNSLKENYPSAMKGLESGEVDMTFTNEAEDKVAMEIQLNREHIRIRMNVVDDVIVWSEIKGSELVAVETANGSLDWVDFNSELMNGACHLVITPSVRLPLKVKLNLPAFHVEIKGRADPVTGERLVEGRICKMEKRFIGKTIQMLLPDLNRVLQRIMDTYRIEWRFTTSKSTSLTTFTVTRSFESPAMRRIMKQTYKKMVKDAMEEEKNPKKKKTGVVEVDDPRMHYVAGLLQDLRIVASELKEDEQPAQPGLLEFSLR